MLREEHRTLLTIGSGYSVPPNASDLALDTPPDWDSKEVAACVGEGHKALDLSGGTPNVTPEARVSNGWQQLALHGYMTWPHRTFPVGAPDVSGACVEAVLQHQWLYLIWIGGYIYPLPQPFEVCMSWESY